MKCGHGWIFTVYSRAPEPASEEWGAGPAMWPDWCAACAFPELPEAEQIAAAVREKARRDRAGTPAEVLLFSNGNVAVLSADGHQMPWLQRGGDWRKTLVRALLPHGTKTVRLYSHYLSGERIEVHP